MWKKVIASLCIFPFCLSASVCPTSKLLDKGEECFIKIFTDEQSSFGFKQCPNGYVCEKNITNINLETGEDKGKCVQYVPLRYKNVGEKCEINEECISEKCDEQQKTCTGKKENEDCESHSECPIGLACIEKKCQKQREINETCKEEYDCVNYAGCSYGKCIRYFSIEIGQKVGKESIVNGALSNLCVSGHAGFMGSDYFCGLYKMELSENQTLECPESGECLYKVYFGEDSLDRDIKRDCNCSWSDSKRYCPMTSDNETYIQDIKAFNDSIQNATTSKVKQHTLHRFNFSYDISEAIAVASSSPNFDYLNKDILDAIFKTNNTPSPTPPGPGPEPASGNHIQFTFVLGLLLLLLI